MRCITVLLFLACTLVGAAAAQADAPPNFMVTWGEPGNRPGEFKTPNEVAVDAAGNIYVADSGNHRIQKFTGDGTFLAEWPMSKGFPLAVTVGDDGSVYVTGGTKLDTGVRKYDSDGSLLLAWGSYGTGDGEFREPWGIAVDSDGYVYVSDRQLNRVQKFTSAGDFVLSWSSWIVDPVGKPDGFAHPSGIVVSGCGYVYVADTYRHRIVKFTADGEFVLSWNHWLIDGITHKLNRPYGVAVGGCDQVYVADTYNHRIVKFDSEGAWLSQWGRKGEREGEFYYPRGLAVDAVNQVYVADTNNHRIQAFTREGVFVSMWGTHGKAPGQFSGPTGVDAAPDGRIYVSDSGNGRIQVFAADGAYLTEWGSHGSGEGEFYRAYGLAVAPDGTVYVADTRNDRIQKFTADGSFLLQWGSFGYDYGQFSSPFAVAVDPDGYVYVADTGNHRIQKFTSDGVFVKEWHKWDTHGGLGYPEGIDADDEYVYVADRERHSVVKFTNEGIFVAEWGAPGSIPDPLDRPMGVALNAVGQIYVADMDNARVQKFSAEGTPIVSWGRYGTRPGEFRKAPFDLAVDLDGYIYVSDYGNHRIQKFQSASPVLVNVSGVVSSDCQGPLAGITVDVIDPQGIYHTTATGLDGSYLVEDIPCFPCDGEVSIVVPLGFEAVSPENGHQALCLGQDQTVDFTVACLEATSAARSMGYWKHQARVYTRARGSAQESQEDMEFTYPDALFYHFHENGLNAIAVEGVTFTDEGAGPVPITLEIIESTLTVDGGSFMNARAKQQYLAFLLNVASGKILTFTEVSEDGRTASEALQYVAGLIVDTDPDNDELAKDISETINHAQLVAPGTIPLDYDYIAYSHRNPRPAVNLRVAPNPGDGPRTFAFHTTVRGPVTIEIFDISGRLVDTPYSGTLAAGEQKVRWSAQSVAGPPLSQGVYFARLKSIEGAQTVKFIHLER